MELGDFMVAEVFDSPASLELIEIVTTQSGRVGFTPNFNINGTFTIHTDEYHNCPHLMTLNSMRQKEQLCDVILIIGNERIKAHKLVLALASPFFLQMFNGNTNAPNLTKTTKINIPDSNSETIKMLIEHAYTGCIQITEDNCLAIFSASGLLQMEEVRKACTKFLLEQMTPENCLEIINFAENQSCHYLYEHSKDYILEHFPSVVNTQEFLQISFEKVTDLVSNDQLTAYSEDDVYNAVMKWIKHDLETRKPFFPRLIKLLRLPLLSKKFLVDVVNNEKLFEENLESRVLLLDATICHLKNSIPPKSLQRLSKMMPYIFVTGGCSSSGNNSECEVFNPKTDTWTSMPPMKSERDGCAAASLGGYIYVAGGHHRGNPFETVESYDYRNNTWSAQKSMNGKRRDFGMCTLGSSIYVCGGYDGSSGLNSVERFDSGKEIWIACPGMNNKRYYCKLSEMENIIYAVGGWDSKPLSIVERYDPRENKWAQLTSMSHARDVVGVATLNNELYCAGGPRLSSCEKFNVRRNSWEPIADMNSIRGGHELVAVGDFLYAIGGWNSTSVEQYDPKTDKWCNDISPMKTARGHFGASVLECMNLEHILEQMIAE